MRPLLPVSHAAALAPHAPRPFNRFRSSSGFLVLLLLVVLTSAAHGQQNQFGGQDRAEAAERLVRLAVQQGVTSLPPTAGQGAAYEYDAKKGTFVRSTVLGPSALRTTRSIGKGKLALRVATSYFEFEESFDPIVYQVEPQDPQLPGPRGFVGFGLQARAKTGIVTASATYGVGSRFDVSLTVPAVVVHASAAQDFSARPSTLSLPAMEAPVGGAPTREEFDAALGAGALVYRRESFSDLGFDFEDDTHVGLGQVGLTGRALLFPGTRWRLGLASELFLPSPSADELAGSDSFAFAPRVVVERIVTRRGRLIFEGGYHYDFSEPELRHALGSGGVSWATSRWSVDCGVRGMVFDRAIAWSPSLALGRQTNSFPATRLLALEDAALPTHFVDALVGAKVALHSKIALAGALQVPALGRSARPAAIGTLSIEFMY